MISDRVAVTQILGAFAIRESDNRVRFSDAGARGSNGAA